MEINKKIPVIIPSYEPDDRLITLLEDMKTAGFHQIIIVDDGSGDSYKEYFKRAEEEFQCKVLVHEVNKGKGRALKTAFSYCLASVPEMIGCVTADSDGQHTPLDMQRLMVKLLECPNNLIIGSRNFDGDDIPWTSVAGNKLTRFVTKLACGIKCSDTQTGLRGIPSQFMQELLDLEGERFEFEMNMLVASKGCYDIVEVPIATIYDSKENHSSHFHPVKDSFRVYKIFLERFLRFLLSSVTSAVIDLGLFHLFCGAFKPFDAVFYVTLATVVARVFSATYNYLINYLFVFKSKEHKGVALAKYAILAVAQMACSAGLVTLGTWLLPFMPELAIKIIVDVTLFIFSYFIQRELVFKQKYIRK